jgi:pimeloyl-ACP methyl ester carboxylesterase
MEVYMKKMQQLVFENLNCEIHYWFRKGTENKWVLFFHGAGVDHQMFHCQFEAFDETYNLIAWDARGHGNSKLEKGRKFHFEDMVSDCKKLYQIHHIKKAILIGQSMGGNLAQEIAYYNPELIHKLVLIDCIKNTARLTFWERHLLNCSNFLFKCYPWKLLIQQGANACGKNQNVKKYVKICFEKLDKATYVNIMMELRNCIHEDINFKFKQPVLLLCGSKDKLGNIKKSAHCWGNDDPNCEMHIIENAAHNSNQDNYKVVNELIIDFLNK